ncbi:hypothetical protein GpartN1_g3260.t1 [Galdieria partita]|uniref:RING-type domain-containing protein n=1 Tax=Galdieria partita TaxID=83374 RepID=A0A9C7UQ01_9RHOD|nr:hypothetical protein GpartN1_g3260.t1 [Galdieria partita]
MSYWNVYSQHSTTQATSSVIFCSHKKKQSNKEARCQNATCSQIDFPEVTGGNATKVYYERRDLGNDVCPSFEASIDNGRRVSRQRLGGSQLDSIHVNESESNKENFPLTSYHFAIRRSAQVYTGNSLLDIAVEWPDVEAVVMFHNEVEENLCCPVCLDEIRAPRVTKCGHLFCLLCILRFFSFHDMAACRCPLCGKKLRLEDLRPVDIRLVAPCYVGIEQYMRLVIRRKESFIARPFCRDSWQSYLTDCSIPDDHKEDHRGCHMQPIYSRIFIANEERLLYLVERDERDIEQVVIEDSSYIPYADYAVEELLQKKRYLEANIRQRGRERFFQISSQDECTMKDELQSVDVDPSQLYDFRFLFQAESGQDVYLHPFNVRCLLDHYEHLCFAPQVIQGKVVEVERCTMTEELKRRMRFLSHLPLGCEFYFVELDLSSILPTKVLNKFAKTLQWRAKERLRREEEELAFQRERDSTPAYEEERKKWFRSQVSFSVDMNEESFPSLGVGLSNDEQSEVHTEEESSYAAVTSHMGYFPSMTPGGECGSSMMTGSVSCWKKSPEYTSSQALPKAYPMSSLDTEGKNILSSSPPMKNKKKKVRVLFSNVPRRGLEGSHPLE